MTQMRPAKEHCPECGAYLSTHDDVVKHAVWHDNLNTAIVNLNETCTNLGQALINLRAWISPIGGGKWREP